MAPLVACYNAEGHPAAYLVQQFLARVAKVARGPVPPSTPPPRSWKEVGTQTEPWREPQTEPWREPLRSTIGTQTDVFVDLTQQEDVLAEVQREVVKRLDVKITDALQRK